ncbi:hypothetical protein C8F01DRAFT_1337948 [Mycena amicta]|nr:hypothetical protein C8F01DRAFT_1337948 [Mycena amicta]
MLNNTTADLVNTSPKRSVRIVSLALDIPSAPHTILRALAPSEPRTHAVLTTDEDTTAFKQRVHARIKAELEPTVLNAKNQMIQKLKQTRDDKTRQQLLKEYNDALAVVESTGVQQNEAELADDRPDLLRRESYLISNMGMHAAALRLLAPTVSHPITSHIFVVAQVVALSHLNWDGSSHCDKKLSISYNGKSADAIIVDECMGCPPWGLDFSQSLFGHFVGGEQNNEEVGIIYGDWSFGGGSGNSGNDDDDDDNNKKITTTTKAKPKTTTTTTHTTTSTTTSSKRASSSTTHMSTHSSSSNDSAQDDDTSLSQCIESDLRTLEKLCIKPD